MSSDKVSLFKIDLSIGYCVRPVHGWRMIALIYFGEMLVASLLAILLLAISPFGLSSEATLFAAGIVAWTFAEYVVHRFVLHGLLPTQHGLHHASPDAAVLTIFWQIWACFALIYLIAGGAFLAGGLFAYSWYLFVHHCAHHGPDMLPLLLLKHHQSHHQFAARNYGVSTTLWDRVFGTMLR
jgi:sterol desaturase/sphingolipid hydroxylase (fatty acid hydroxylase superfamily)